MATKAQADAAFAKATGMSTNMLPLPPLNLASTSGANASGASLGSGGANSSGQLIYNAKGSGGSVSTYLLIGLLFFLVWRAR